MVMDNQMFRAICAKVADEKDPKKLELLQQRLRLLLSEQDSDSSTTDTQAASKQ
jgi:hypothetical protein